MVGPEKWQAGDRPLLWQMTRPGGFVNTTVKQSIPTIIITMS